MPLNIVKINDSISLADFKLNYFGNMNSQCYNSCMNNWEVITLCIPSPIILLLVYLGVGELILFLL